MADSARTSDSSTKAPSPAPSESDVPKLSVYVYQSKLAQPNCVKNLVENLAKQKEAGSLAFDFHATESVSALAARLTSKGDGIAVLSASDEKEMQQVHLVLGKLSQGVNQGLIRVLVVSRFSDPKTIQNLKVRGAYEILDFNMNVKSLLFKMNTAIKLTEQQHTRMQASKAKTSSIQDSLKNAKKQRSDNSCTTVHEKSDEHAADFWILPSESNVRYVMGRVVVELLGPGPALGHWTSADSTRNEEPGWLWSPRFSEEGPFFKSAMGRWIFYGRQPDFSWQTNLWNFVSKAPYLAFIADGVSEPLTVRFQKDGPNKFKVKKNVTDSAKWLALIKETIEASLKQKDTLNAEKAANDYRLRSNNEGATANAKDYLDKAAETKELAGKFGADKKEYADADDFIDESTGPGKELSSVSKAEKAREMRRHASVAEKKPAFNSLGEASSSEDGEAPESEEFEPYSDARDEKAFARSEQKAYGKSASLKGEAQNRKSGPNRQDGDSDKEFEQDGVEAEEEKTSEKALIDQQDCSQKTERAQRQVARKGREATVDPDESDDELSSEFEEESADSEVASRSTPQVGALQRAAAAKEQEKAEKAKHAEEKAKRRAEKAEKEERAAKAEKEERAREEKRIEEKAKAKAEEKAKLVEQIAARATREKARDQAREEKRQAEEVRETKKEEVTAKAAEVRDSAKGLAAKTGNPKKDSTPGAAVSADVDPPAEEANTPQADARGEKPVVTTKETTPAANAPALRVHENKETAQAPMNVGDLSEDEKSTDVVRAAKIARFEIEIIGKNGAPLSRSVPIQLVEIDAHMIRTDAGNMHFSLSDRAQIRIRFECEPNSVTYVALAEVKAYEPHATAGVALTTFALEPEDADQLTRIVDALSARRELLLDFFRMARGEGKNEQAA